MGVNPKIMGFPPKSSILYNRFSLINYPFWGTPIFGNTHICSNTIFEESFGVVNLETSSCSTGENLCNFLRNNDLMVALHAVTSLGRIEVYKVIHSSLKKSMRLLVGPSFKLFSPNFLGSILYYKLSFYTTKVPLELLFLVSYTLK